MEPKISKPTVATPETLFSGPWIRWQALTLAERFVCANLVGLPLWWLSGLYYYLPAVLLLAVVGYQLWQRGNLGLRR
ncbi:MAG: hypothetical protein HC890_17775, partial [Chloroflexaceae bacterium]|nr:hypothetical protein [Chloroflexaceae bacterium]